jgi:hypothetical protein
MLEALLFRQDFWIYLPTLNNIFMRSRSHFINPLQAANRRQQLVSYLVNKKIHEKITLDSFNTDYLRVLPA